MRLLTDRDENDNHRCTVQYKIVDGVVWEVVGVARRSSNFSGDPMRIFGLAMKNMPRSDGDAQKFTVASWNNAIKPTRVNLLNPPKSAAMYEPDAYELEMPTYVDTEVWWTVNGLKESEEFGVSAFKANSDSSVTYATTTVPTTVFQVPKEIQEVIKAVTWNNGSSEVLSQLGKYFDLEQKLKCHKDCPLDAGIEVALKTYVVHLNDKQGWNISKISDHLEELPINIQMKEKAALV